MRLNSSGVRSCQVVVPSAPFTGTWSTITARLTRLTSGWSRTTVRTVLPISKLVVSSERCSWLPAGLAPASAFGRLLATLTLPGVVSVVLLVDVLFCVDRSTLPSGSNFSCVSWTWS